MRRKEGDCVFYNEPHHPICENAEILQLCWWRWVVQEELNPYVSLLTDKANKPLMWVAWKAVLSNSDGSTEILRQFGEINGHVLASRINNAGMIIGTNPDGRGYVCRAPIHLQASWQGIHPNKRDDLEELVTIDPNEISWSEYEYWCMRAVIGDVNLLHDVHVSTYSRDWTYISPVWRLLQKEVSQSKGTVTHR